MYESETIRNLQMYRERISRDKEAIYDTSSGIRYTYGDMNERSEKLSWFLTKVLRLRKGDRIGFLATNNIAMFDAYYATYKTGIIITTYNGRLKEKELFALIDNEGPKVLFYTDDYEKTTTDLKEDGFDMAFICLDGQKKGEKYSYKEIMEMDDYGVLDDPKLEFEDIQMLIHTGGTTGRPKAAMLSFRSMFYNSLSDVTGYQLSERDTAILCLPLFHTAGWNVLCVPLLFCGGRIILNRDFDPELILKLITEERPTVGIMVELMYKALTFMPEFEETDFSCYRYMVSGAAPIGRETLEVYWQKGVKLVNAYGMTEIGPNNMSHPASCMPIEEVRAKWNSCGIVAPFNQIRIVDEDGNDVPQGEKGEFLFSGMMLFSGYWNNPEATAEVLEDGWVHTGDMGYVDKDNFYYISGRRKNMYISGGENVFPQEIEDAINTLPGVSDVCIFGVPDDRWGEVGKALVIKEYGKDVTREEIVNVVKKELSTIRVPKYICFVDEIPVNAIGKRDLKEIKRLYGLPEE